MIYFVIPAVKMVKGKILEWWCKITEKKRDSIIERAFKDDNRKRKDRGL